MEKEIGETIKIGVEAIIAALLIGCIALFGGVSYSAYGMKMDSKAQSEYIGSLNELYYFNNKVVTGSDIVELIMTYTRTYDYQIEILDGAGRPVESMRRVMDGAGEKLNTKGYIDYWKESNIRKFISGYEKSEFTSELIRDPITNTKVEKIVFILR